MMELRSAHTRWHYWQLIAAVSSHLSFKFSSLLAVLWFSQSPGFLSLSSSSTEPKRWRRDWASIEFPWQQIFNHTSSITLPWQFVQGELNTMIWFRLWSWSHWSFNQYEIILYQLTPVSIMHLIISWFFSFCFKHWDQTLFFFFFYFFVDIWRLSCRHG